MKKLIGLVAAFMVSSVSQAGAVGSGVMLGFNGFIHNQTREVGGNSADDNLYIYDIKLGYLTGTGWYFGGIYSTRNHNGSAISEEAGSATGASVGYMGSGGFYLMGHYYVSAKLGDYKDGSGMQADFGYMTNVSGAFHVGVELTYRNMEYKLNSTTLKTREMVPLLTAAFVF